MNLLLQVFFSLHVSLSEVCAFYSKENIFYILLTVDFFVVNIFCIFIYKSHKKNSNVQLYTLNLQLEENKVNSVVSRLKRPTFLLKYLVFFFLLFFFFLFAFSCVGNTVEELRFLCGDWEKESSVLHIFSLIYVSLLCHIYKVHTH